VYVILFEDTLKSPFLKVMGKVTHIILEIEGILEKYYN
jgi:hypothetical protein